MTFLAGPLSPTWLRRGCSLPAWLRALLVAATLAGLIHLHGCHGPDEDHELFTPLPPRGLVIWE